MKITVQAGAIRDVLRAGMQMWPAQGRIVVEAQGTWLLLREEGSAGAVAVGGRVDDASSGGMVSVGVLAHIAQLLARLDEGAPVRIGIGITGRGVESEWTITARSGAQCVRLLCDGWELP